MNRRTYLVSAGGALAVFAGGTAAANATRADILADSELTRGEGEAATRERTIRGDSVEYVASTNEVRENDRPEPFERWARREGTEIGADTVLSIVENRLEKSVEGVGSGVRYLLFGPVVTVDHTVTRERDGATVSEPNVRLERLVSVAPRTMTVTVSLEEREFTTEIPVGVGHSVVSLD